MVKLKLRTRLVILAIMWLVTIALVRFTVNTYSYSPSTGLIVARQPASTADPINFKTMTVSVCENESDFVNCHDEIKVVCGDNEYLIPKMTEQITCGSLKMKIPSITAFAVFDQDWKDPRAS